MILPTGNRKVLDEITQTWRRLLLEEGLYNGRGMAKPMSRPILVAYALIKPINSSLTRSFNVVHIPWGAFL